jgi:hypothetical protein
MREFGDTHLLAYHSISASKRCDQQLTASCSRHAGSCTLGVRVWHDLLLLLLWVDLSTLRFKCMLGRVLYFDRPRDKHTTAMTAKVYLHVCYASHLLVYPGTAVRPSLLPCRGRRGCGCQRPGHSACVFCSHCVCVGKRLLVCLFAEYCSFDRVDWPVLFGCDECFAMWL